MKNQKKQPWKIMSFSDAINLIVGIVLLVSIMFIYRNPTNRLAILIACIAGGLINILTGIRMMKDPKRKSIGLNYLLMGMMIIVLGFIITQGVMK